jgi:hypothetical protein
VVLLCTTTLLLKAQDYEPNWFKKGENFFNAVDKNTESNFTMDVIGTIDGERCDSAYEIGVFCGDECRATMPYSSSSRIMHEYFGYYSVLTINGEAGENFSFRLYDHRNNVEVGALTPPEVLPYVADKQYGSFNEGLYNLAFNESTTHRAALAIDDATDLPFTGKQYSITADGIACCYTRNAYLDGGYETIVLPFDADIASITSQGFVFEKFEGFGNNTIRFVELEEGEMLKAGVAYIFRYSGTPSDDRQELLFEADVQQINDEIITEEGWAGTFKAMSGNEVAGKYILNLTGDKMQKAGSGASLAPYHACLTLPEHLNTAMLTVVHSRVTTGIDKLQQHGDGAEIIYDLSGRIIKELPRSGMIIKNQKKIYVR